MSEYKGIKGFQVQTRTEDPTPFAQALADNPYAGVWASGGNLNTAKSDVNLAGTQTQAVGFAGDSSPGYLAQTENYNGSSWPEVNDLSNARAISAGNGAYTSALCYSGLTPAPTYATTGTVQTESWDGTNWTEVNDLNTARRDTGTGIGASSTSALCGDGRNSPPNSAMVDKIESWDGSSWTEVAELNTPRFSSAGAGSQTSAMIMSGRGVPGAPGGAGQGCFLAETWNGSTWTETTEFNTMRSGGGSTGANSSAILLYGGFDHQAPGRTVNTESWDGSSWTEVNNMATARNNLGGTGPYTIAITAGGVTPSYTAATEEWAFSGIDPSTTPAADYADAITGDFYYNSSTGQFKTVNTGGAPIGTWASGGSMNTARRGLSGAGIQTAAVVFGGYISANSALTELYDGSSWTEVSDLNSARFGLRGIGTTTAAFGVGGGNPRPSLGDKVESWDGSSWTETTEVNTGRMQFAGVSNQGTTTALIVAGGYTTTNVGNTESWNGSAWTEVNDLNTASSQGSSGLGTQTAALAAGKHPYASPQSCEQWDGTNWTEVAELNTPRGEDMGSNGTTTSGLLYGGYFNPPSANKANTESWNGSTWTEQADLSTARYALSGSGASASSAIAAGGYASKNSTATEEWTAADFQIK